MAIPRAARIATLRSLSTRLIPKRSTHLDHRISTTPVTATTINQRHTTSTRHFTTTPSLSAVRDSSTIDFAYLPSAQDIEPIEAEIFRVPILHHTSSPSSPTFVGSLQEAEEATAVMKPEISTMSADTTFSTMVELSDGHAMNIDFAAMAGGLAANIRKSAAKMPVEARASLMKQLWNDMVDDMMGTSSSSSSTQKKS